MTRERNDCLRSFFPYVPVAGSFDLRSSTNKDSKVRVSGLSYVSQFARCTFVDAILTQWPDNRNIEHLIFLIFKHLANLTMKFTILAVAAALSTASAFSVPVSHSVCLHLSRAFFHLP
jgi:hypothetical protein